MNVKEIRDKSNTELLQEIESLKEELFNLRFQQATGQLENPSRMKEIRKTIARIKTVITERELSEADNWSWKDQTVKYYAEKSFLIRWTRPLRLR